jgi:coproporphyrinogen III oxidase
MICLFVKIIYQKDNQTYDFEMYERSRFMEVNLLLNRGHLSKFGGMRKHGKLQKLRVA